MEKTRRAKTISLSLVVLSGAALATALVGCVQEPPPFDPRAAQQWERAQDSQVQARPMYPLPTTLESPYIPGTTQVKPAPPGERLNVPEGPPVKMSLQEIVHRTVVNSLDIRVAGYDTAVDQTRVIEAEANFDPSFFTNFNFERDNKESGGIITSFDPVFNTATKVALFNQLNTSTFQTGFQQKLPAGGEVKLQYQVQNTWTNPQQFALNPFYENELSLTVTQPLLQNFGLAVNQARITIARNNQRVSLLDWRKTVEDTVLQVEKLYWQLVQANRDVETLQRLVAASEDTTNTLFHRQGADVTAVQIQQSNAATETRRVQLIAAQSNVANLSDQIKRLMYDPSFPVSGAALIVPADDEMDVPVQFNLDDAIETGLENRLELGQQQVRIDSADIAMQVAKNNLLPQLNFQGSVTSDGVARRLDEAFNHQGDFSHIGYAAGLQFQIPLGNRAARAIWQRALLQRQQAIDSYRGLISQVTLDVKTAARQVDTSWKQLHAARNARFAAEKFLAGLQQQQDAGTALTQDFVDFKLRSQEQLAQAEEAEHQSMNDYNFAIANLEKAKGTLLRYNNVILEEQQLPFDMAMKSRPRPRPRSAQAVAPSLVGAPAK
jgi:outer membrane protein TolC